MCSCPHRAPLQRFLFGAVASGVPRILYPDVRAGGPALPAPRVSASPAPRAIGAGAPTDHGPPPSPPLSIVANGPERFAGRKFGVLVTDDVNAALLNAFRKAATAEGALVELIAPHIRGFVTSDGELIPAHQKIDGGPSVVYDAVVILVSAEGAALLAADATAKDFVTDAHAHCKFIAYTPDAVALLDAAGVGDELDDGYIELDRRTAIATFVEACRDVRYWARTPTGDQA